MRMSPQVRKDDILEAAIRVASRPGGWASLTRAGIAHEAGCSEGLISRYHGSVANIRRKVMKKSFQRELWSVVGQGVACGYPACMNLPTATQVKAMNSLAS